MLSLPLRREASTAILGQTANGQRHSSPNKGASVNPRILLGRSSPSSRQVIFLRTMPDSSIHGCGRHQCFSDLIRQGLRPISRVPCCESTVNFGAEARNCHVGWESLVWGCSSSPSCRTECCERAETPRLYLWVGHWRCCCCSIPSLGLHSESSSQQSR